MTVIEMRAKNSIDTRDRDFDFTENPIHRDSSAPSNSSRDAIKLSEESESFRPDLFFDDKPSKPKDTFKSKSVKYLKRVDASMMTVGALLSRWIGFTVKSKSRSIVSIEFFARISINVIISQRSNNLIGLFVLAKHLNSTSSMSFL